MTETITVALFVLGAMLTIIGWLIVYVLNSIKTEIRDIKEQLGKIETDLHGRITTIDIRHGDRIGDVEQRLAVVEARCEIKHGVGQ